MTCFRRPLLAAGLLALGPTVLHAAPASGSWTEKTQELAGGLALRSIQAESCYADRKAGVQEHVDRIAQRVIDPSCTSEPESKLDAVRFAVRCGGAAFGDGLAVVIVSDDQSMRISIRFLNHATGMEMEYQTDASWNGPDCRAGG